MRPAAALVAALGAVVVTTAAAAPRPHVERARSGAVIATFSYSYDAARFRFGGQHLTIRRSGVTRFTARVRRPPDGGFEAQPAGFFSHERSVSIRDLDGDGEPEVVLDLYWGGAHCCWYTQIYRYAAGAGRYRPLVHVWGNVGYEPRDLDGDGLPELVTRDDRFSYAFASFADSRRPLLILDYRDGRLRFVTSAYPRQLGRDATSLWREAMSRGGRRDNEGSLAAWAADECQLGHGPAALATLDRLRRARRLHGTEPPAAYVRNLRRFLRRTGYL